jgi:hypothetical protein
MTLTRTALLTIVALALVSACGGVVDDADDGASNEVEITRAEFGTTWPFTVESGILSCEEGGAVVFTAEGVSYGLNASATALGYESINPIWADAPGPTGKVSITPVMSRGIRLCERGSAPGPAAAGSHRSPFRRPGASPGASTRPGLWEFPVSQPVRSRVRRVRATCCGC